MPPAVLRRSLLQSLSTQPSRSATSQKAAARYATPAPIRWRQFTSGHSVGATPASTSHPASAIYTASTSEAEADAKSLRALFDAPEPIAGPSSSAAALGMPTGLFGSPSLTSPESFLDLAKRTLIRAQLLVARIADSPKHGPKEMKRVVRNLDRLSDLLCGVIDCAELVRNAHPDQAWVQAANAAYEYLCGYMNVLNTHTGLYEVLAQVVSTPDLRDSLSPEALAVANVFLRDFEKSGIHLPAEARSRFVGLSDEILVLGRAFLQGAPDDGMAIEIPLKLLEGTPAPIIEALSVSSPPKEGVLKLRRNSWELQAVSKYSPNEDARLLAYKGLNGSPKAQVETLEALLHKRAELAVLTGNESFAAMTLGDKMARKPGNVDGFLHSLASHHRPRAEKNMGELKALKGNKKLHAWDRDYLSEQYLRLVTRATATPPITPFFSVGTIFAGLSRLFERLYGIRLRPAPVKPGEVWAKDVSKMEVVEEGVGVIGTIYADLYSRTGKPPSAAHYTVRCSRRTDVDDALADYEYGVTMDGERVSVEQGEGQGVAKALEVESVSSRAKEGEYQLPIVVLLCDFVRPTVKDGPSLLSWHEVETLFHEMGHAIHSMIGRTEYHNVSGTRCATDFVELPSILMEHFVSSPSVVGLVARHHSTDAPLPYHHLAAHLKTTRSLDSLDTHNQILLATLDQLYHSPTALQPSFDTTRALYELQDRIGLVEGVEDVSWQANFSHLFGYGATYYSYLFDRAIASRVWSQLFQRDPLDREAGEKLKMGVLSHGGGKDPWKMLAGVLNDEEIGEGDSRAMRAVGRWGIADAGTQI